MASVFQTKNRDGSQSGMFTALGETHAATLHSPGAEDIFENMTLAEGSSLL